jgi:hypothetical protein
VVVSQRPTKVLVNVSSATNKSKLREEQFTAAIRRDINPDYDTDATHKIKCQLALAIRGNRYQVSDPLCHQNSEFIGAKIEQMPCSYVDIAN